MVVQILRKILLHFKQNVSQLERKGLTDHPNQLLFYSTLNETKVTHRKINSTLILIFSIFISLINVFVAC